MFVSRLLRSKRPDQGKPQSDVSVTRQNDGVGPHSSQDWVLAFLLTTSAERLKLLP
jgi:hypothetical protein